MSPFTQRVIHLIRHIPKGKVACYGQIAKLAGNPRGTRGVTWILHSSSETHQLPWHRVINSKGLISTGGDTQRILLEAEGVEVDEFRVDLETYLWRPSEETLAALF